MNEVFKKVEEILEELRCEAEEREYFVQTEQAEKAAQELKKVNREYEKILIEMPEEYRIFVKSIWILWIMQISKNNKERIIRE